MFLEIISLFIVVCVGVISFCWIGLGILNIIIRPIRQIFDEARYGTDLFGLSKTQKEEYLKNQKLLK
jgi:hypothetical protein